MSKEFRDIDHSIFHRPNPSLVNKALCLRRHAMDASILLVARFTLLQKKPCLDQRCQQATCVELYYLCWSGFDASRHEAIWISQVSNMNWPGWPMFGDDVPCIGHYLEMWFLF